MKESKDIKSALDFSDRENIKEFIHTNDSSIYSGTNVDGEKVAVMLQLNEGMEVYTYQSNGWTRVDYYDGDGFHEGQTFDGRWASLQYPVSNIHGNFFFNKLARYDIDILGEDGSPYPLSNVVFDSRLKDVFCFKKDNREFYVNKDEIVHAQVANLKGWIKWLKCIKRRII